MNIHIRDGKIEIEIDSLVQHHPEILRQAARSALFEEEVITALVQLLTTDHVQWSEDETPWWRFLTGWEPWLERARQELAKATDATMRKLIADLTAKRDKAAKECDIYQRRAWRAEDIVRRNSTTLIANVRYPEDADEIRKTMNADATARPADL